MYANKEDALNDENVLDTQKTNEKGVAIFENDIYYGRYIKESRTLENYQIRNKEKDMISVYRDNGVRFLGEIASEDMKVTSINQNGTERTLDPNKNVNQELQKLTSAGLSFNDTTNWLVFNDNGKEKLIAKKPLKWDISWICLYKAGVVFGQEGIDDLINANFSNTFYYDSDMGKDSGKGKGTPKTYKPTYVTVNNKKYIVRLMRAYNERVDINNHPEWNYWRWNDTDHYNATKGSEWNRLILPLIDPMGDDNNTGYAKGTNGRYGSNTNGFIEKNMPTLANYSWWRDFGGNSYRSGIYDKGNSYGSSRWMQETGYDGSKSRASRGIDYGNRGAGNVGFGSPSNTNFRHSWQPVLERIE